jgi:hypothetical protein
MLSSWPSVALWPTAALCYTMPLVSVTADEASHTIEKAGYVIICGDPRTLALSARTELSSIGVLVHAPRHTRERWRATMVRVE